MCSILLLWVFIASRVSTKSEFKTTRLSTCLLFLGEGLLANTVAWIGFFSSSPKGWSSQIEWKQADEFSSWLLIESTEWTTFKSVGERGLWICSWVLGCFSMKKECPGFSYVLTVDPPISRKLNCFNGLGDLIAFASGTSCMMMFDDTLILGSL